MVRVSAEDVRRRRTDMSSETMTHTWDATLGFLALYEDIQEEARKEILEVAPANSPLVCHAVLGVVDMALISTVDLCRWSETNQNSGLLPGG